jgi:hypothetical protein
LRGLTAAQAVKANFRAGGRINYGGRLCADCELWCTPKVPLNGGGLNPARGGLVLALEGFSPSTKAEVRNL